jgi:hypothetical protein
MKKTVTEKYQELSSATSQKLADLHESIPTVLQEESEIFQAKIDLIHRRYKIEEAKLEAYEEARFDVGYLEMEVDGWRERCEKAEEDYIERENASKTVNEAWDRLRAEYGKYNLPKVTNEPELKNIMDKIIIEVVEKNSKK